MTRWYLDNAATSFPKPSEVVEAVTAYLHDCGAPAGRGAYRQAVEVGRLLDRCRQSVARMWNVSTPGNVVLTFSGTDSLNMGLLGLCRPGDHVISTTWEHNSVLRPLRMLSEQRQVAVTFLEPDSRGLIDPQQVQAALRDETRLVTIQHANNVIGVVQPIAEIGGIVRNHGAFFLVDAAQSAGHLSIDMQTMSIDLLACSGHKGLLGPLGTGLLVVGPRVEHELFPLRWGGTGTRSEDDRQPPELPERLESGNHNVPGISGLMAALEWIERNDAAALRKQERQRTEALWNGLCNVPGIELFGAAPDIVERTGVISLQLDSMSPEEAALILDEHFGIECRSGLHCAPGVHRQLGTIERGGTLRLSVGPFLSIQDIEYVIQSFMQLCGR